MSVAIRPSEARGHANHGWLDSHHTFSFAHYYDPKHMGFGPLGVINEDRVQGGSGFPTHGHSDMEIISYVLDGALEHKDSIGTGSVIRRGDVQRMSAGTGVRHSEFNHSAAEPVHFLQIWIEPETKGLEPSYEEKYFDDDEKRGKLLLIASRDGREGSITVHRDVDLYATILSPDQTLTHRVAEGRGVWLQVARGTIALNGQVLKAGDGVAVTAADKLQIEGRREAEVLLFDMAMKLQ
jgi:redox-sensitive bicupin YhaK (pirin superfamily)